MKKLIEVPKQNLVRIPNSTAVFVKCVTHRESRELEGRTLHPAALHKLLLDKTKTDVIGQLLFNYGAYFAVVFAFEKPMEQYINNGNLSVSATYGDKIRELVFPVDSLIKARIDKSSFETGGKALYIYDGYDVDDSKNNLVVFKPSANFTPYDGFAAIRAWLKGNGWRQEDGGLASTRRVTSPTLNDVYNDEVVSKEGIILGSGWRGGDVRFGYHYERGLHVGNWFDGGCGVFKESAGTSLDERSNNASNQIQG